MLFSCLFHLSSPAIPQNFLSLIKCGLPLALRQLLCWHGFPRWCLRKKLQSSGHSLIYRLVFSCFHKLFQQFSLLINRFHGGDITHVLTAVFSQLSVTSYFTMP